MAHRVESRLLGAWTAAIVCLAVLPLAALIWLSFFNQTYLVVPPDHGYTLSWYTEWSTRMHDALSALWSSISLAVATAAISTIVGLGGALGIRKTFRGRAYVLKILAEGYLSLPIIVPSIIVSISIYLSLYRLQTWLTWDLVPSFAALLAGHVLITLPWTFHLCNIGIASLDANLERASRTLGRSAFGTMFRITIPLLRGSIASAVALSFIFSLGQLEVSLFLAGPNDTPLPVFLVSYASFRIDPSLAVISVIQWGICGVAFWVAWRLFGANQLLKGGSKQ